MGMMAEFKEFAMKGNVMDLAVGVIIGGAFGKIVESGAGHDDRPAGRPIDPRHHIEQRTFSGPRGPHDGEERSRGNREGEIAQHGHVRACPRIGFRDPLERDDGIVHGAAL